MSLPSFAGLRVLVLESRRAAEMATLVSTHGGEPVSAPALREVPLESNTGAIRFLDDLERGEVDLVVAMTGVGLRALLDVAAGSRDRAACVAALARTPVAARGPKPVAVLRELGIVPWVVAPEPNTWRELLGALDAAAAPSGLAGRRVAVQEYGVSNPGFLDGLRTRGAIVTVVPVYRYAMPDDTAPLSRAAAAVARGEIDVALFTTATQVLHLLRVAGEAGLDAAVRSGFRRLVVASIGPTTSETLREEGLSVDLEATHPKMGLLVREAALQAPALLAARRRG